MEGGKWEGEKICRLAPPAGDYEIEAASNSLILNEFLANLGGVYHTPYHRKCARVTSLAAVDSRQCFIEINGLRLTLLPQCAQFWVTLRQGSLAGSVRPEGCPGMEILGEICEAISIKTLAQVPPCAALRVPPGGLKGGGCDFYKWCRAAANWLPHLQRYRFLVPSIGSASLLHRRHGKAMFIFCFATFIFCFAT